MMSEGYIIICTTCNLLMMTSEMLLSLSYMDCDENEGYIYVQHVTF